MNPLILRRWGSAGVKRQVIIPNSYLIYETFEDPSTGYDNNNTNQWVTSGTVNPKYSTSPAPLAGNQSVFIDGSTNSLLTTKTIVTISTCSVSFVVNISQRPATGLNLASLRNSTTAQCRILLSNSADTLEIRHGATASTSYTYTPGQTYYMWIDYVVGTGANGVVNLYISTTVEKPVSATKTITTGTATASIDNVQFNGRYSTNIIIDNVCIY